MVKDCHLYNKHWPAQPVQPIMQPDLPSSPDGNKLGTDIYVFNRRKYLIIIYYYQNYIIPKLTREIMENKPPLVPDVIFMNFMSGIFSSKTLMSI